MKKRMKNNALIVFLKNGDHGKVKTRIAQTMGHHLAYEIYERLQRILQKMLSAWSGDIYLYFSDRIPNGDLWAETTYQKCVQMKGHLGVRMYNALEEVLTSHSEVVLIGSDCPYLKADIIVSAFDVLTHKDVVLGPAIDGGYYLIGMKKNHRFLFDNITWSTSSVLDQTINILHQHNVTYGLLEPLSDIDTQKDWEKYLRSTIK